jgi:Ferritin-like domain
VEIEVTQSGVEAEQQRLPRRSLLAAGIGGAAVSLLPFLSGRASASATTTTTAPASTTTTTEPPRRPTDDDVTLLAFAQQLELTAAGLYEAAIAGVAGWSDVQASVMTEMRESHLAYGNTLSGLLGKSAPGTRSEELFAEWKSQFTGSTDDVLTAAAELESAGVATHLDILAKLQGLNGAAAVASILVAEARHCTALLDLAGSTDLSELLVDTEADSLLGNA